jgi:hypothetical protein
MSSIRLFLAAVSTMGVAAAGGFIGAANAQGKKLGAYAGTVAISGTEFANLGTVTFRATVKITLPIASASERSARAEVDDVDKPSATALVTQWDVTGKNASPDSDGKVTSWKCSLAAPTEVPMNASGALDVDYRKKAHSMFVALVSTKSIPLKCVNSRSGPYKQDGPVSLFFGTSEPDVLPWKELPFADAGRLAATYRLVPVSQMKGRYGPVDLQWDFRLAR